MSYVWIVSGAPEASGVGRSTDSVEVLGPSRLLLHPGSGADSSYLEIRDAQKTESWKPVSTCAPIDA